MARYLVTSSSHFEPLTYDELVKPLAQMTEAHNNAQAAYDQISLETNALENYISKNPEDAQARALYDNYKNKLLNLQQNLWNNGYTTQTASDLSAARAGYASDVLRLQKAVQARQERSNAYWTMRHNNPDMVAGEDPGLSGLDNYLANDRYGLDYYNYSGKQFTAEVAADAQARAKEYKRSALASDPKISGYISRIETTGYTSDEVSKAGKAVEDILFGGANAQEKLAGMEFPERILAEVLLSHMESSGAERFGTDDNGNRTGNISAEEYRRLFNYGKEGLSHAIGSSEIKDFQDVDLAYQRQREMQDRQFQHARDMENLRFQHQQAINNQLYPNGKGGSRSSSGTGGNNNTSSGTINATDTDSVPGNREKVQKQLDKQLGKANNTVVVDGKRYDSASASALVFSEADRRASMKTFGFDYGRTGDYGLSPLDKHRAEQHWLHGEITGNDGKVYETRYNPNTQTVQVKQKGSDNLWANSQYLTKQYRDKVATMKRKEQEYMITNPELYKMATINPDKQYDIYKDSKTNFADVPLAAYRNYILDKPENQTSVAISQTWVARASMDKGKFTEIIPRLLASVMERDKDYKEWKAYDGQTGHIHKLSSTGQVEHKTVTNPGKIFFDAKGNSKVVDLSVDTDGLMAAYNPTSPTGMGDGYMIFIVEGGDRYAVGFDMFKDDGIKGAMADLGARIVAGTVNPGSAGSLTPEEAKDKAASLLRYNFGFAQITKSASGSDEKSYDPFGYSGYYNAGYFGQPAEDDYDWTRDYLTADDIE